MMKTLKNLGIAALTAVLSPLILVAGIFSLPYLLFLWIKGIVSTAAGKFPSGYTRFDEKYIPEVKAATLDLDNPSLQVYSNTVNNNYNITGNTVDNSTRIESHDNQVVNNYYFGDRPQPALNRDRGPETLETGITFDPDAPQGRLNGAPNTVLPPDYQRLRGQDPIRPLSDGSDYPALTGYGHDGSDYPEGHI